MAIQQIPITRGGKQYTLFIGIDAAGDSILYVDEVEADALTGQPVRFYPEKLTVNFGKSRGGVAFIHTEWNRGLVGASGEMIPGTEQKLAMVTNEVDVKSFVAGLGMPILRSIINGFIRAILGFASLSVFDAMGNVIPRTPEEEASPATNDYHPVPEPIEADATTNTVNPQ